MYIQKNKYLVRLMSQGHLWFIHGWQGYSDLEPHLQSGRWSNGASHPSSSPHLPQESYISHPTLLWTLLSVGGNMSKVSIHNVMYSFTLLVEFSTQICSGL